MSKNNYVISTADYIRLDRMALETAEYWIRKYRSILVSWSEKIAENIYQECMDTLGDFVYKYTHGKIDMDKYIDLDHAFEGEAMEKIDNRYESVMSELMYKANHSSEFAPEPESYDWY